VDSRFSPSARFLAQLNQLPVLPDVQGSGYYYLPARPQAQFTSPQKTLQENTSQTPKSLTESDGRKKAKPYHRNLCFTHPGYFVELNRIGERRGRLSGLKKNVSSLLKDFPKSAYS
jgi:beta-galactosidase GanA